MIDVSGMTQGDMMAAANKGKKKNTRLLTKAEACQELGISLSTLDRRIASGEIEVRREPRGRRHRIYVILGGDMQENGAAPKSKDMLQEEDRERLRSLRTQVELLQGQLGLERKQNAGLEKVYRQQRAVRDRMRRVDFILGLVVAGLMGLLVISVLALSRLHT